MANILIENIDDPILKRENGLIKKETEFSDKK